MNYTKLLLVKLFTFFIFINSSCSAVKTFLCHCVKSVHIQSFFCPYFPVFGLNTKIYTVNLLIQSEYIKIRKSICLKSAWKVSKYRVSSGPYFLVFELNIEVYSVNLRIQSEYRKILATKNSVFGHFSGSVVYTDFALDLQCLIISILSVIFLYEMMEIILERISFHVLLINKNDFWYHFMFVFPS